MGKISKKTAIKKFLILQIVVALVLYIGLWRLRTDFAYTAVLFIELYAFSIFGTALTENGPLGKKAQEDIDENAIYTTAFVISAEKTNMRSDFGEFYKIKLALDDSPTELVVELEMLDSKPMIKENTTVPVLYMPNKKAAMILFDDS